MRYRKKPVVIEAEQYNGPVSIGKGSLPPEAPAGVVWKSFDMTFEQYPMVPTLEGEMPVRPGDWIITGVKGERYPCKPDIFEATYEPVE